MLLPAIGIINYTLPVLRAHTGPLCSAFNSREAVCTLRTQYDHISLFWGRMNKKKGKTTQRENNSSIEPQTFLATKRYFIGMTKFDPCKIISATFSRCYRWSGIGETGNPLLTSSEFILTIHLNHVHNGNGGTVRVVQTKPKSLVRWSLHIDLTGTGRSALPWIPARNSSFESEYATTETHSPANVCVCISIDLCQTVFATYLRSPSPPFQDCCSLGTRGLEMFSPRNTKHYAGQHFRCFRASRVCGGNGEGEGYHVFLRRLKTVKLLLSQMIRHCTLSQACYQQGARAVGCSAGVGDRYYFTARLRSTFFSKRI